MLLIKVNIQISPATLCDLYAHCERPKGEWPSHKKRLRLPRCYAPRNDMGSSNFGTYPIVN